jgi:3-oxoacyl-[acyl-carrier-protein] synthase-3
MARAQISGVGAYVPDFILTNQMLSELVDTNDEWITSRSGIKERRILKGENKGTSFMAINAVNDLLNKTNASCDTIELLICATVTPDMPFPATANLIADKCGLKNAFSYDINAACSGFMFALQTAAKMIESGTYKKIIVVGADKMSSIMDYTDRNTCVLFGDGAAAVLLEQGNKENGIIDAVLRTDGSGWQYLHQKAGGSALPASHDTVDKHLHYVYQEGKKVFSSAVVNMAEVAAEVMQRNNLKAEDVAWLVPHQANMRIIEATRERTGIPIERVMVNIDRYGNTTNATIPLCLWEWEHKLKKGDNLILAAFGGGFTWGSIYLKWAY